MIRMAPASTRWFSGGYEIFSSRDDRLRRRVGFSNQVASLGALVRPRFGTARPVRAIPQNRRENPVRGVRRGWAYETTLPRSRARHRRISHPDRHPVRNRRRSAHHGGQPPWSYKPTLETVQHQCGAAGIPPRVDQSNDIVIDSTSRLRQGAVNACAESAARSFRSRCSPSRHQRCRLTHRGRSAGGRPPLASERLKVMAEALRAAGLPRTARAIDGGVARFAWHHCANWPRWVLALIKLAERLRSRELGRPASS